MTTPETNHPPLLLNELLTQADLVIDKALSYIEEGSPRVLSEEQQLRVKNLYRRLIVKEGLSASEVTKIRAHRMGQYNFYYEFLASIDPNFKPESIPNMSKQEKWRLAVAIALAQTCVYITGLQKNKAVPYTASHPEEYIGENG